MYRSVPRGCVTRNSLARNPLLRYYSQFLKEHPRWYFNLYPNVDLEGKARFPECLKEAGWTLYASKNFPEQNSTAELGQLLFSLGHRHWFCSRELWTRTGKAITDCDPRGFRRKSPLGPLSALSFLRLIGGPIPHESFRMQATIRLACEDVQLRCWVNRQVRGAAPADGPYAVCSSACTRKPASITTVSDWNCQVRDNGGAWCFDWLIDGLVNHKTTVAES